MGDELAALPRPREGFSLLCVRCGAALFYVRQDRARGVLEHYLACRRCGQKHAAWRHDFEPYPHAADGVSAGATRP